jgi:DNA repair photolyase
MLRFRLSITTDDENLLRKWEPGAPSYEERIHVLRYLHAEGWKVGLSIAPMLDIQNVVAMYNNLEKYCNDTIYVAKMAEGEKLVTRGSLKAEDIALLHSQCADLSLLKSVSSQLKKSSLFAPKFCIHEYD